MGATEERAAGFQAVPNDASPAVRTFWRQLVNGAFEAIGIMGYPVDYDFQRLVIIVAATFPSRAPVTVALIGRFLGSILAGFGNCLALNHAPNVECPTV